MPDPIIKGTRQPIITLTGYIYDPENGYTYTQEWSGLGEQEMIDLGNQFSAAGIKNELVYRLGVAHLQTTNTTTNVTIDTWTIVQNEFQKSSFENQFNIFNLPADKIITLAQFQTTGSPDYSTCKAQMNSGGTEPQRQLAVRLLDRIVKGQTDFTSSGYVLRHTTNVGNRYSSNISDFNIDCIYTTSQLLSETTDKHAWVYPLPGRLAYKIQSIASPIFRSNYLWGWLKRGSTETTAANNRVNITTEYWLDQWNTDEYLIAS